MHILRRQGLTFYLYLDRACCASFGGRIAERRSREGKSSIEKAYMGIVLKPDLRCEGEQMVGHED